MTREGFAIDSEAIAAADKIFHRECKFVAGADNYEAIPASDLPEVAFAGRSNVGKSSLINALTFRKNLARASNTPGRTQQINFFDLGGGVLQLADLPGYGYAKASKSKAAHWNEMVEKYLATRSNLKRVCVLIDGRHGILDADRVALGMLDDARVPYIAVLTKVDKIKASELVEVTASVEEYLGNCAGAFPKAYPTSSEKGQGLSELRAILLMA